MDQPSEIQHPVFLDRTAAPHIVTLTLMAGLAAMNMNIFLPSLPGMARYFQTDYALMQLAVSGYLGVTAVLQVVIGPLSDRYGRRPVMLGCILIFLVASLGCLLAPSAESFLLFRMFSGTVVGGMILSRAIVRDMVPPDRAASMLGYVTMGMALVPMVSPMIGGVLDELFGWHSIFVVLIGAGLGLLWLVRADLGETNRHRSTGFAAQFRAYPELVRSQRFWGYSLTIAFTSGAFFALLGGGPYVARTVYGLGVGMVGVYMGTIAIGYMFGNFVSGRLSMRVGIDRMLLAGAIVAVISMILALLLYGSGLRHPLAFFAPVALLGVGNGLAMPNGNAGLVSVRPHLAGSASGLGGLLMVGGGAALSALAGALLGPESGAWPLLIVMLTSTVFGVITALHVRHVARRRGALGSGAS
ncbi:MAG: Bcr/CflA family efflux MFS transporter [Alphaproteobacteria bacterium]|nr:MAG: Bcr/CflA family efflux MFS transporter [Alphaproteobacteria bacterium]